MTKRRAEMLVVVASYRDPNTLSNLQRQCEHAALGDWQKIHDGLENFGHPAELGVFQIDFARRHQSFWEYGRIARECREIEHRHGELGVRHDE
jgi:hypothetical protein